MKKAVFFDIDGTLIDSFHGKHDISPEVKEAIRELQAEGYYAFIATGRPYAFISEKIWNFGFDGFVLSNGAQVVLNGETVYESKMDPSFVKELAKELDKHHIEYVLEGEHYSYISKNSNRLCELLKYIDVTDKMIKKEYNIEEIEVYKAEIYCDKEEIEKHCTKFIEKYPEIGYYYSINGSLFEVFAKCNHKAKGVEKALEIINVPIERSYAFGDGENDMEMLETVGCGIAMGNASDHVKECAKVVTKSVGEDGVAFGIREYIQDSNYNESAC